MVHMNRFAVRWGLRESSNYVLQDTQNPNPSSNYVLQDTQNPTPSRQSSPTPTTDHHLSTDPSGRQALDRDRPQPIMGTRKSKFALRICFLGGGPSFSNAPSTHQDHPKLTKSLYCPLHFVQNPQLVEENRFHLDCNWLPHPLWNANLWTSLYSQLTGFSAFGHPYKRLESEIVFFVVFCCPQPFFPEFFSFGWLCSPAVG